MFPAFELHESLDSLLDHSHPVDTHLSSSTPNMASQSDVASVDGSVSSITESQWDVVDEASAASEDESGGISRQPTPFSDPPEPLRLETGSLAGNDTSSESQGLRSPRRFIEFNRARRDSNSDPPDTARRTVPLQSLARDLPDFDFCREEQEHHIRFAENGTSGNPSAQGVSFHLTDLEGEERKELLSAFELPENAHVRGTLRQQMSRETLRLAGPFKILYHGKGTAKAPIVEKIGTALAAHLSTTATNPMDSSRVTVVPVSSITENNAPDVVLIDSMGLDMNIEECTFAGSPRGGAFGGTMSLTINNQKSIESSWNPANDKYEVSGSYQLPHLAVFYLSGNEDTATEQTRSRARAFLARHSVPTILISSSLDWSKKSQHAALDLRSPHLCLESVEMADKEIKILKRLPVDLNTFLAIDAGQMNRNLACLTSVIGADAQKPGRGAPTQQPGRNGDSRGADDPFHGKAAISVKRIPVLLLTVAWVLLIFCLLHMYRGTILGTQRANSIAAQPRLQNGAESPSLQKPTSSVYHPPRRGQSEGVRRASSLMNRPAGSDLVAMLLETSSTQNKSEKFKAQIVGDSHVVLRPPGWFNSMKKPPLLHFKVQRANQEIPFEFSTLFDGIYALKLPSEDAHGVLNISVWTVRRPQVNESFRVDFGSPWLKVKGWWQSARVMTDSVKGEFSAAQESVSKAYKLANQHLERAEHAFREVEKATFGSLRLTTRTAQLLMENSKKLSSGLSKKLSARLLAQQQKLNHDISDLSKTMSAALVEQVAQMRAAAAGLDVLALRYKIRAYREQNFRQAQIKMLHTWWKIRGSPAIANNVRQHNCKTRRGRRSGARAGACSRR